MSAICSIGFLGSSFPTFRVLLASRYVRSLRNVVFRSRGLHFVERNRQLESEVVYVSSRVCCGGKRCRFCKMSEIIGDIDSFPLTASELNKLRFLNSPTPGSVVDWEWDTTSAWDKMAAAGLYVLNLLKVLEIIPEDTTTATTERIALKPKLQ